MALLISIRFPIVLSHGDHTRIYAVADESRREHFTQGPPEKISIPSQCLELRGFQQKKFAHHRICDKKYSIIMYEG